MVDLIILGGGPAGLTAAVYALRRRLDVLLISPDLGGKTNQHLQLTDVSRHLSVDGSELVGKFVGELKYLGSVRVPEIVDRVQPLSGEAGPSGYRVRASSGSEYEARALIVATGASPRRLDVPGESEYRLRGVVYSAVNYASLFVGRAVVVVGSSALALRSTAELARGGGHVTLVATDDAELTSPLGQFLIAQPNVTLLTGYVVERITGNAYANGLVLKKGQDHRTLAAEAVFVELGLVPNSVVLNGLMRCDVGGHIMVDGRNRTSAPGIFAAGDVTDVHAEQVLVALGEGAKAALSAHEYLLANPAHSVDPKPTGDWR